MFVALLCYFGLFSEVIFIVQQISFYVTFFADGDESLNQKKERRLEMAKKRLANSEVIRDLHREYTDGPDEIRVSITHQSWL